MLIHAARMTGEELLRLPSLLEEQASEVQHLEQKRTVQEPMYGRLRDLLKRAQPVGDISSNEHVT